MAMRTLHTALVVGVAATMIGFGGAASAQTAQSHVMTVRLPGGGLAQIEYSGNVAPHVSFSNRPVAIDAFGPMMFGPGSPLAMMDRLSAAMDRQMAAMFQETDALASGARAGPLNAAALGNLLPGSQGYSFISTLSGNGVCSQSVTITSQGNGAPPRVVRHSSGNCGPAGGATGSIALPTAPAPAVRPHLVWTSAHGAKPYAGLVHEIPTALR
jgi:hypothetical protein